MTLKVTDNNNHNGRLS